MNNTDTETDRQSVTVLLVDDEQMIIDVITRLLNRLGYHVIGALGGEQAIDVMKENGRKIDIVILDMLMPGMNGEETFYRIREIRPHMPVLLASGYHYKEQIENVLHSGCNGFVKKPYRAVDLDPMIQNILAEAKNA